MSTGGLQVRETRPRQLLECGDVAHQATNSKITLVSHPTLALYPLPNELFLLIVQRIRNLGYVYYEGTSKPWNWIVLSHVCRCWRNTLVRETRYWTNIDARNIDRAETYVSRSGSALLTIWFDGLNLSHTKQTLEWLLQVLQRVAHRTRFLAVILYDADNMATFIPGLTFPFPKLDGLHLNVGPTSSSNAPIIWRPMVVSGQCRLYRLKLRGVYIPLDVPIYHSLHHLDLSWISYEGHVTIPSTSAVLDVLVRCPNLRTFTMFNWRSVLNNPPETRHGPDFKVELPYLQVLGLGFHPKNIAYILPHLSLSPTATIRIRCTVIEIVDNFDILLLEDLYPHSPTHFKVLSRIESLNVTTSWEEDELSFQVHAGNSTDPKLVDLSVKFSNMGDDAITWLEHAVPAVSALVNLTGRACSSSPNLCKVVVSRDFAPELSAQDWCNILYPIPAITHLEFRTTNTHPMEFRRDDSILEALSSSTTSGLPCPRLQVLQLSPIRVDATWAELLKTCLHRRAELGGGTLSEIGVDGIAESDVHEAFRELAQNMGRYANNFTYSLHPVH